MELPLEVINHSLGRESADLPAHNEILPDYFPPLPAEEMMFLHQSGLVSDNHIADPGAEVKIPVPARGE